MEPRLERFIGVIYRPETERWSHYSEAVLPDQFDAWVWFDETEAVTPLPGEDGRGNRPAPTKPGRSDFNALPLRERRTIQNRPFFAHRNVALTVGLQRA